MDEHDLFAVDDGTSIDQSAEGRSGREQPGVDRRQFLKLSAGAIAALTILPQLRFVGLGEAAAAQLTRGTWPTAALRTFRTTLRRREDFVVLNFDFYNLLPRTDAAGGQLVRLVPGLEAWVVVEFPPQHVLEEAFLEAESASMSDPLKKPGTVGARLARPSRLAFVLPSTLDAIPYDIDGLLTWASWVQKVVPAARPAGAGGAAPALREPAASETAIELPWWLILSPSGTAGLWTSRLMPRTVDGRTELWHTSLDPDAGRAPIFSTVPATRAVWARDWNSSTGSPESRPIGLVAGSAGWPFKEQSLIPVDRRDIVTSSTIKGTRPRPLEVNRLLLSALGGWLDARGEWDPQATGLSLESWLHRATQARDHYVRVIRVGYLFPIGHRAVLVEVTERKPGIPADGDATHAAAYLRKRLFIVVREPVRTYPGAADPFAARALPFTSIRLITTVTPKLDGKGTVPLTSPPAAPINTSSAFIPSVGGVPFAFEAIGIDHEGREIPFASPVVFVDGAKMADPGDPPSLGIYEPAVLAAVVSAYNVLGAGAVHPARPDVMLGGRPVALAPVAPGNPGSTRYDTRSVRLFATPPVPMSPTVSATLFAKREPPFAPVLQRAEVRLEAAEITGGAGLGWQGISYLNEYVTGGFGAGEVFAKLESPQVVSFDSEGRGGGVATPNLKMTGLSRSQGAIGGDPVKVSLGGSDSFDPTAVFTGAKLLGGIKLSDVLSVGGLSKMPQLKTTLVGPPGEPTAIDTVLYLHPNLKPSGILTLEPGADFTITGRYRREFADPDKSIASINGDLRKVTLTLVPGAAFIAVTFNRVSFKSETGRKTEINVDIGGVQFLGALAFISKLSTYIKPVDGTPAGPYLEVSNTRVLAGLSFALPAVQVGAFVVENAKVRTGVNLPLDGTPVTTRFGFSTREDPFHLTVLGLGGGGFVGLEIGADGPKTLDISLEAGAMVALNLGVAKGKLEAFAGFYYRLESGNAKYTAFARMSGSLRVLGLVTVSAKFYLELTYSPKSGDSGKFQGSASLTFSIDLGLCEKEVSVKVSRTFAGDGADPFLIERVTSTQWTAYCDAFAVGGPA